MACAGDDDAIRTSAETSATTTATSAITTATSATTPSSTGTAPTTGPSESTAHPTTLVVEAAVSQQLRAVFSAFDPAAPGCSAAVSDDGEVVWAEGFGMADIDAGAEITPETRFDIGSTSKQFTATAILLLEADGDLDRDMTLSEVVDEMPTWASDVTIADLLHHTSGIPDYLDLLFDAGYVYEDRSTQADAVAALHDVAELDFEPGSDWSYSNSNYLLLAEVVSAVSGTPLPEFLAERVFAPLELDMVMDPVGEVADKAVSYERPSGVWEAQSSGWEQVGDGAIQTTPSQLVRWAAQYWEPTLGGPVVLAARTGGAVETGEGLYGAGIIRDGEELSHGGAWLAFVTELVIRPLERTAAAVTCNVDEPDPTALAEELLAIWADR